LANIRETDAILHVLRCFDDGNIIHVDGSVDPIRDKEIIDIELQLKDLDSIEKKIQSLRKRAERSPDRNIQAVLLKPDEEARQVQLSKFNQSADRVLVDSPCGGHGVLRRNPDSKWNRKPLPNLENSLDITDLQKKVVTDYAPLVKIGGELIYGVCTFSKKETLDQVDWIKSNLQGFELQSQGFVGPYDTDGFFMASFIRKN
jgi:16S rRNA C967 or C1407 C5-methylase (RsmB/RsmF family)